MVVVCGFSVLVMWVDAVTNPPSSVTGDLLFGLAVLVDEGRWFIVMWVSRLGVFVYWLVCRLVCLWWLLGFVLC